MNKKKLKKLFSKSNLKKECDDLWFYIIKYKAGFKSELSGNYTIKKDGTIGGICAHHILAKPNFRLRYEIKNGICLTLGEHKFGIHNPNRQAEYLDRIINHIGKDTYEWLKTLKWCKSKGNLVLVKVYLQQELDKLKTKY